ncbi:MAG: P1 family peptidase [Bacillota bacterium]
MKSIVDVPGIKVGHAEILDKLTGCTVVLFEENGVTAGVDIRGGAPGSRESALLDPVKTVDKINAIFLTGGSAFGLDATSGVMEYFREKKIGFETGIIPVPIVPASVIFDFMIGEVAWPDGSLAYSACKSASDKKMERGNVGAGIGATIGKINGPNFMMKSGVGTAYYQFSNGVSLGVLVVLNTFGDIRCQHTGQIIAGAYDRGKKEFLDTMTVLENNNVNKEANIENTTLVVIGTDANLDKTQAKKVAELGQNGLARSLSPAHTMLDGDTVYAVSTGEKEIDLSLLGNKAAEVISKAILDSVHSAEMIAEIPSLKSIKEN